MCLAFRLSEELGVCSHGRAERVEAHFKAVGLPTKISDIPQPGADAGELQRLMGQDKKVKGGKLAFILARDIGDSYVSRDVPPETVRGFLTREIAR
jgi:shikimate kinase/3-dehydroquinate synthase